MLIGSLGSLRKDYDASMLSMSLIKVTIKARTMSTNVRNTTLNVRSQRCFDSASTPFGTRSSRLRKWSSRITLGL